MNIQNVDDFKKALGMVPAADACTREMIADIPPELIKITLGIAQHACETRNADLLRKLPDQALLILCLLGSFKMGTVFAESVVNHDPERN